MGKFLESINEVRELLGERSRALATAQREINPLKAKGDNPIKKVVTTFRKALRTRKTSDVNAAKWAHHKGIDYASHHGLPNLVKQLSSHQRKIPKPKLPKKKPVKKTRNPAP